METNIMKLELKHLAPYLPYGLDYYCLHGKKAVRVIGFEEYQENDRGERQTVRFKSYCADLDDPSLKPILRPLSDLTKEIEINGEKFVPIDFFIGHDGCEILNASYSDKHLETIPYNLLKYLIEWHFDVFGLIEQGLAVDINTLKK